MPGTMAKASDDAAATPANRQPPMTEPATPDLTEDGCTTDDEAEELTSFRTRMHLAIAQRRIIEVKNESVAYYVRATKAEKHAAALEQSVDSTHTEEFNKLRQQLAQAQHERDAALLSLDNAKEASEQAKLSEGRMHRDLHALAADLQETRSTSTTSHISTALDARLTEREAKIDELVEKNERLTTEHAASQEALAKMKKDFKDRIDHVTFYRSLSDNLRSDQDDLRTKLAASQRETEKIHNDHSRFLSEHHDHHTRQNANGRQDSRLAAENTRLKHDVDALGSYISKLRTNMAYNITQLDLSFPGGWRLFNCYHNNFRDVPDGANSTREIADMTTILYDVLMDWVDDHKFVKEYNDQRRTVIQHHRAHERAQQGRGVSSHAIKTKFQRPDEKRGIPIKY